MAFVGKWNFDRAENMEEFLVAAGAPSDVVSDAVRKRGSVEYSQAGDNCTIKTVSSEGTLERTFQCGKPFEMEIPGYGKKATVVASNEGGKLVFRGSGADKITETREVQGDTMVVTLTKPGVDIAGKCFFSIDKTSRKF
ncbi:fatty acid-binding protein Fh15-like [Ptychodera flava]|uniref:fatty acid-binding protein Fh15-like n=1 Tax=Ptychodera flava TaxID=63121 RepID=UPI00396A6712